MSSTLDPAMQTLLQGVQSAPPTGIDQAPIDPTVAPAPVVDQPNLTPDASGEVDAASLLSSPEMGDLGDPKLLESLQEQAKGGMSVQEAIGLAALSMANPQMATMLISQRAQGASNARSTLAKLSQQSALTAREGAKNRLLLEKATGAAEAARDRQERGLAADRLNKLTGSLGEVTLAEGQEMPVAPRPDDPDFLNKAMIYEQELNKVAGPAMRKQQIREIAANAFIQAQDALEKGLLDDDPEAQLDAFLASQGLTEEEVKQVKPMFGRQLKSIVAAQKADVDNKVALADIALRTGEMNIKLIAAKKNAVVDAMGRRDNDDALAKARIWATYIGNGMRETNDYLARGFEYSASSSPRVKEAGTKLVTEGSKNLETYGAAQIEFDQLMSTIADDRAARGGATNEEMLQNAMMMALADPMFTPDIQAGGLVGMAQMKVSSPEIYAAWVSRTANNLAIMNPELSGIDILKMINDTIARQSTLEATQPEVQQPQTTEPAPSLGGAGRRDPKTGRR